MAEEAEGQETGAEASGTGVDPFAAAMALGSASQRTADAFLNDQRELIGLQKHHLREQFKQLRLNIWQQRLGVLLRIATGFVGLAVAAGLAFMIWNASQSSGLLIEPFSVPPDLAARGMTGEVVAAKLLDHISQIQTETISNRAAQSYVNDWGQAGIKLDIPETGISLTELDDFLREKLGRDTHITGEVVDTASGVSLTARAGGTGAESVTGSETDLDGLVQQLSEKVYHATQPYRFGMYLAEHDRYAEAIPILKALAETSSAQLDRAFGHAIWGHLSAQQDNIDTSLRLLQGAMEEDPDNSTAQDLIATVDRLKSLPEQAMHENTKALTLLTRNKLGMYSADASNLTKELRQGDTDDLLGDFREAALERKPYGQSGLSSVPSTIILIAESEAGEHDLGAARATMLTPTSYRGDFEAGYTALYSITARMQIDSEAQDWAGVLSDADAIAPMVQKFPGMRSLLPTTTVPLTAYAEARLGKTADAEKHISATPAECYDCLISRARIGELEGQHGRADYWFARAVHDAPSIPMAYAYWGQAVLERADADGAIAKFTIANQKGPKFADPLEMWGEALMKKNRSDLAVAKFIEAEKYGPNWGRLHLKWGEALGYAGKKDEAHRQFAIAAGLVLSDADKSELSKVKQ